MHAQYVLRDVNGPTKLAVARQLAPNLRPRSRANTLDGYTLCPVK